MVHGILLDAINRVQAFLSNVEGAGRCMRAQEIYATTVAKLSPQLLTQARAYLSDCKANGTLDDVLTSTRDECPEIPASVYDVIDMLYGP